jgi:hypothetical protein
VVQAVEMSQAVDQVELVQLTKDSQAVVEFQESQDHLEAVAAVLA